MILVQTFTKLLQTWLRYLDHKPKTINLGLFYGMGKAKLQAELGVTKEAADLFNNISCSVFLLLNTL